MVCYDRTIFENLESECAKTILNIKKIIFKVVQMKFLAMHITNQNNVLLAIAINIPQRPKTAFVLQGHMRRSEDANVPCHLQS